MTLAECDYWHYSSSRMEVAYHAIIHYYSSGIQQPPYNALYQEGGAWRIGRTIQRNGDGKHQGKDRVNSRQDWRTRRTGGMEGGQQSIIGGAHTALSGYGASARVSVNFEVILLLINEYRCDVVTALKYATRCECQLKYFVKKNPFKLQCPLVA